MPAVPSDSSISFRPVNRLVRYVADPRARLRWRGERGRGGTVVVSVVFIAVKQSYANIEDVRRIRYNVYVQGTSERDGFCFNQSTVGPTLNLSLCAR